jgi:microtubule-associated protein 1
LKNFLLSPTGHKHLIHAGYSFTGTGSWMLEDGVFGFQDLVDALQDNSVQNFFRSFPKGLISIHIHCSPVGQWIINDFEEQNFSKFVKVELNPPDSPSGVEGAASLLDFFDETLKKSNFESKMNSTEIVGNIRFNRPTLYIFPSGQGDCSLFGITGFTMLIDGGFTPIPSFWNFVRHLERLDAIMVMIKDFLI